MASPLIFRTLAAAPPATVAGNVVSENVSRLVRTFLSNVIAAGCSVRVSDTLEHWIFLSSETVDCIGVKLSETTLHETLRSRDMDAVFSVNVRLFVFACTLTSSEIDAGCSVSVSDTTDAGITVSPAVVTDAV